MRAERNNPRQVYSDFRDWLRFDNHVFWIFSLFFAYIYYLLTTDEI
jgi:hypothetical protein